MNSKDEFDPNHYVTDTLSFDDVVAMKAAFDFVDKEEKGQIKASVLKNALIEAGMGVEGHKVDQMINRIEGGEDSLIDFDKFIEIINGKENKLETEEDVRKAFKEFTGDEEGYLDFRTFKKIVKEMGEDSTDEELKKMFETADTDMDGYVQFEEFYYMMTKKD